VLPLRVLLLRVSLELALFLVPVSVAPIATAPVLETRRRPERPMVSVTPPPSRWEKCRRLPVSMRRMWLRPFSETVSETLMPVEEVPLPSVLERLDYQSRLLDYPSHGDGVRLLYSVIFLMLSRNLFYFFGRQIPLDATSPCYAGRRCRIHNESHRSVFGS
jgi:hypothetical protein